jgi:hypothetical protein
MVEKVKKRLTLDSLIYVLVVLIIDFKTGSGYFCFYCAFFEWQVGALSCNMNFFEKIESSRSAMALQVNDVQNIK